MISLKWHQSHLYSTWPSRTHTTRTQLLLRRTLTIREPVVSKHDIAGYVKALFVRNYLTIIMTSWSLWRYGYHDVTGTMTSLSPWIHGYHDVTVACNDLTIIMTSWSLWRYGYHDVTVAMKSWLSRSSWRHALHDFELTMTSRTSWRYYRVCKKINMRKKNVNDWSVVILCHRCQLQRSGGDFIVHQTAGSVDVILPRIMTCWLGFSLQATWERQVENPISGEADSVLRRRTSDSQSWFC